MQFEQANLYERVFACWLEEQNIPFVSIDQSKRFPLADDGVKNFDFLLYPDSNHPVLIELKGRTFHGTTLAGLTGLDAWVPFEDVEALTHWHRCFQRQKGDCAAFFVFTFLFEQIDVETDGQCVYDFADQRFLILAAALDRYRACMKPRSRKWQTVSVTADDFREIAIPIKEILKPKVNINNPEGDKR